LVPQAPTIGKLLTLARHSLRQSRKFALAATVLHQCMSYMYEPIAWGAQSVPSLAIWSVSHPTHA